MKLRAKVIGAALATMVAVAMAQSTAPQGEAPRIAFIEIGRTSRSEALSRLGPPFATYQGDRVLTWRLTKSESGGLVSTSQTASPGEPQLIADYELVLVFGRSGYLDRNSLVALRRSP
jgi:hypothetical protein